MSKLARSWELARASLSVLKSDKELMLFPLMSAIAILVLFASFIVPAIKFHLVADHQSSPPPLFYVWMGCFYLAVYFVGLFFNTALVGAVLIRLGGGNPTVGDGLSIAWARAGRIFGYAVIAATVGVVLNAVSERLGFVGRFIIGLVGLGWAVATFLVVPVLAARDVGPVDAIKDSAGLLRRSWGENLAGNAGLGLVTTLVFFVVAMVGFAGGAALLHSPLYTLGVVAITATVIALVVIGLGSAALTGIYSAAVYRFAVDGTAPAGFDGPVLRDAFKAK
jgi:hypothetical protein